MQPCRSFRALTGCMAFTQGVSPGLFPAAPSELARTPRGRQEIASPWIWRWALREPGKGGTSRPDHSRTTDESDWELVSCPRNNMRSLLRLLEVPARNEGLDIGILGGMELVLVALEIDMPILQQNDPI